MRASTAHGQAFMHMDDLADANALTVERRRALAPDVAILLGEPEVLSYDELQHTFAVDAAGKRVSGRGLDAGSFAHSLSADCCHRQQAEPSRQGERRTASLQPS